MSTQQESPAKEVQKTPETPISDAALPNGKTTPPEYGGRKGPEATRFGDWEMNGKCVDF
jgi:hypothetical protein